MERKSPLKGEIIAAILLLGATVILILFLALSEKGEKEIRVKDKDFFEYFDTICTLYDYSGDEDAVFEENCRLVEEKLRYYHELFDIYNEYEGVTNLATVNRLAGSEEVEVAPELIEFLNYAVSMHELTDGNVNIAFGRVLTVWHDFREGTRALPTFEELALANQHSSIENLVINSEKCTVKFTDSELLLDVGAIAKGYAAEKCAEFLRSRGAKAYVLDLGGNLRIVGEKPDGGTFKTGVQNPDIYSENRYVYYLNVADTSVVTSGDYQRAVIVDGKNYHHIINKETLFPAEHYSSVTVVTEHSGLADALSTALFNMKKDDAVKLLDTLDGVSAIWVYPDGRLETYGLEE